MQTIHIIILAVVMLLLFYGISMSRPTEHMQTLVNPVPDFNAYQPMESPADTRYVYYPEEGVYLLPYEELDMTFPYHRWMYYYYPSFYSSYYSYDWPFNYPVDDNRFYYGGSYGGDFGGDFAGYYGDYSIDHDLLYRTFPYRTESPNRVIIPTLFQSPKFNTQTYPSSRTGFAGGRYSQRFSNAGSSLRRGSIQGRSREGFDVIDESTNAVDSIIKKIKSAICDSNSTSKVIASRGGNSIAQDFELSRGNSIAQDFESRSGNSIAQDFESLSGNSIAQEIMFDTTPEVVDYAAIENISRKKSYDPYPAHSLFARTQLDYPDDEFGYVINDDTIATISNKSAASSNETNLMDRTIAKSGLEQPVAVIM